MLNTIKPHNADVRIIPDLAETFRPMPDIAPVDSAESHVMLELPGGYYGTWDSTVTPQMVEPLNMLASRSHEALIYVGPAQSGKTQALVDCWISHVLTASPADMMIVQTSMETARDFSKRRLDRMLRNSPSLKRIMRSGRHSDNIFDKQFKAGSILSIGWPSINQLSGKPIKYIALTDYDRMPASVGAEGDPFGLARKRTTTFMTGGMTLAESSPGGIILDPKWTPTSPHEAPPTRGIMALYNQGDQRRWYWPCPECEEYFESGPGLKGVWIPDEGSRTARAANARLICTECGTAIHPDLKTEMNARGRWVPAGMGINRQGELYGPEPTGTILSYWQDGLSAAFQDLKSIVANYLRAHHQYEKTGIEVALQTTVNVDQSMAYLPITSAQHRKFDPLLERRENWTKRTVPEGARFLTAAVDVQGSKFAVMVWGWGVEQEQWMIDRFDLQYSPRGEGIKVEPAAYIEDWEILVKHVIHKRYPLDDGSDREMSIHMVGCDSGGVAGVTDNAYAFWKKLKKRQLHRSFVLVKGASVGLSGARYKLSYPEATSQRQKGRYHAPGLVPVLMINADMMKDACFASLERGEPGSGYVHFPIWQQRDFFEELTAEDKDTKGRWVKTNKNKENESWDLMVYNKAIALHAGIEKINWENPSQGWVLDWDRNSHVEKIGKSAPTTVKPKMEQKPDNLIPKSYNPPINNPWIRSGRGQWL